MQTVVDDGFVVQRRAVRVRSKLVRLNYVFTSLAISQGPKQTNSRTKFFFSSWHSFFFRMYCAFLIHPHCCYGFLIIFSGNLYYHNLSLPWTYAPISQLLLRNGKDGKSIAAVYTLSLFSDKIKSYSNWCFGQIRTYLSDWRKEIVNGFIFSPG